ncbi:MAG: hypothetical protein AAF957_06420 [Planctomycetota bacterium]
MSTQSAPEPGGRDDAERTSGAASLADGRAARLCAHVEAYLRLLRRGGSPDPEPHLARAGDLADDLAPLLDGVRRMEVLARRAEDAVRRRDAWRAAVEPSERPETPEPDGPGPAPETPSTG